jgi:hypothetical protein
MDRTRRSSLSQLAYDESQRRLRVARGSDALRITIVHKTYSAGLVARKRIFLLSPANLGGIRAKQVMSDAAAVRVGAATPDSGRCGARRRIQLRQRLVFFAASSPMRGASVARPSRAIPVAAGGVLVITPNAGLRAADVFVTLESLRRFATQPIDHRERSLPAAARTQRASIA